MSYHPQESYSSIEIYRPIQVEGDKEAQDFIAKARYYGEMVLGVTPTTYISEPEPSNGEVSLPYTKDSEPVTEESVYVMHGVGSPRVKFHDSLKLTLLSRRIPGQMNYGYMFRRAGHELLLHEEAIVNPIKEGGTKDDPEVSLSGAKRYTGDDGRVYRTSGLWESLDMVGLKYGITNQDEVQLACHGITVNRDEETGAKELALTPAYNEVAEMLLEQANVCFYSLKSLSVKAAYSYSPNKGLSIPFARISPDVGSGELVKYIDKLHSTRCVPVTLLMRGYGKSETDSAVTLSATTQHTPNN